jgi:hypothetical protein
VLQVDGYAAYKALVKRSKPGRIRLAFCLAHARCQFVAVHKTTQSPEALDIVQRIAAVYAIATVYRTKPLSSSSAQEATSGIGRPLNRIASWVPRL